MPADGRRGGQHQAQQPGKPKPPGNPPPEPDDPDEPKPVDEPLPPIPIPPLEPPPLPLGESRGSRDICEADAVSAIRPGGRS